MNQPSAYTINGIFYSRSQLMAWCNETTNSSSSDQWELDIAHFILDWFDEHSFIMATSSGTTGTPKKIELDKVSMAASAQVTNSYFKLDHQSTALLCLPAKYIGGKMMLVRMLISGMNLWFTKPTANPLANLPNTQFDFCPMIPLQVETSIKSQLEEFKNIKNVIIGGAPISHSLEKEISTFDNNIYATFGMTETLSHVALRKLSGLDSTEHYKALNGISFELNNELDLRNCLIINAPHLQEKPFYTRDVVDLIDDHTFVWKGRKDHIINSGGIKFSPEFLEKNLVSMFTDSLFFIAGIVDDRLGTSIILFIEGDEPSFEEDIIKAKLKEVLPKYGVPKRIVWLSSFLKTETGKVKRDETVKNWLSQGSVPNTSR